MSENTPESSNGWNQWSKHVLLELERLNLTINAISRDIQKIKEDTVLKSDVKSIETKHENDIKDFNHAFDNFRLESTKELTMIKAKIAIFAAIIGTVFGALSNQITSFFN
jgi:GTP:adenosylcobinamide-phosphate guanylyltransferase